MTDDRQTDGRAIAYNQNFGLFSGHNVGVLMLVPCRRETEVVLQTLEIFLEWSVKVHIVKCNLHSVMNVKYF